MDTPFVKRAYNLGLKAVPNFLQLSEEQIAFYEKHLSEIPAALLRGFTLLEDTKISVATLTSKFGLLVDLGIITVPVDYMSESRLFYFKLAFGTKFFSFNGDITDANFWNPTRIMKPGDRLWVRAHKQIISGTTTSEEHLEFLASLGSYYTGAQGASLVFEQKRSQLPKGYWYGSFDEKDRLLGDEHGHRVPGVGVNSSGNYFSLGFFERPWRDLSRAFLSFCDEPAPAGE